VIIGSHVLKTCVNKTTKFIHQNCAPFTLWWCNSDIGSAWVLTGLTCTIQ